MLPTKLDGVSVTIGGTPAYVSYVSPGQINVVAPDVSPGPVAVVVTSSSGTSSPFTVTAGQYSPAVFVWPGNQAVATHLDFSYAVKAGTFPGIYHDTSETWRNDYSIWNGPRSYSRATPPALSFAYADL